MEKTLTKQIDLNTGVVTEETHREDGELHRNSAEGPAYIQRSAATGQIAREAYYERGKLHRTDGPAEISYFLDGRKADETWYREGTIHRDPEKGPALIERWMCGGKVVPVVTEYVAYGHPFRHPKSGPYRIERDTDGSIENRLFAETADEAARGQWTCKPKTSQSPTLP